MCDVRGCWVPYGAVPCQLQMTVPSSRVTKHSVPDRKYHPRVQTHPLSPESQRLAQKTQSDSCHVPGISGVHTTPPPFLTATPWHQHTDVLEEETKHLEGRLPA